MNYPRSIVLLQWLFLLFFPLYSYADDLFNREQSPEQQIKINLGSSQVSLNYSENGGTSDLASQGEIDFGIFGDVSFSTKSREKANSSFFLGELDLYTSASYGDRVNFLGEIALDPRANDEFEAEFERLWIGYTFSDLLTVRAGRHHTALGYWNKNYHHGRHLFVTIDRPFFLAFEHSGGILPVHITGLELEGRQRFGFGLLKYEIEFGNGPKIDLSGKLLKSNIFSDNNESKQLTARISANPLKLQGLNIGASGTFFKVDTSTRADLEERVYGIDISYLDKNFELLAEYFRLVNAQASGNAFYIQVSRRGVMEHFTPYARYERLDVSSEDPYFKDLSGGFDRYQVIAGVRYDMDIIASSIKAQYRYDDADGGNDFNVFEMQWSFGF